MRCARNLEQTPSLIDADAADDVGSTRAAVSVGADGRGARRAAEAAGVAPTPRLYTAVRWNTVGSSRPTESDTPLPSPAVYWMLFTPVTVSWPPIRNELLLPG